MSLETVLSGLSGARDNIRAALTSKGFSVSSSITLNEAAGLIAALPDSGGIDVTSTTAEAGDVLSGKVFYTSGGIMTSGTIPILGAGSYTPTTSAQIISAGQYLSGNQTIAGDSALVASNILSGVSIFGVSGTLDISSGADVTLGYITSGGQFQPLTFSGTSAADSGSAVTLSCYTWNLPESSGGSSGGSNLSSGVIVSSGTRTVDSGWTWIDTTITDGGRVRVSSSGLMQGLSVAGSNVFVSSGMYLSGGVCAIFEGGSAYSATVSSGGVLGVGPSSGYASQITVLSGGICIPCDGGIISGVTVSNGGTLEVWSGGTALDVTSDAGASVIVHESGTITYTSSN